jgi:squalene synthase HpnC
LSVGHYENFPVASLLLPARLRRPVGVIYRFARSADDIADEGDASDAERIAGLDAYRGELDRMEAGGSAGSPLFRDLGRVVRAHALPLQPFRDLLDAFSQDVRKNRYATFGELLDYCRRSANPVGNLLLHLFGRATPQNLAHSDSICTALQLVNFWQDAAIDYAKGRIYLPQDEMARFGVTETQLAASDCGDGWRALIDFQIDRTRAMFRSGAPLGHALPGRLGLEIRTVVQGGLRILEKLEQARGDVYRHRPVLRAFDWPLLLWRAIRATRAT